MAPRLGVTGGIGSGKTTVCRMLEDLGARVFYADAEARRILHEDAGAREATVAAFGDASYGADGALDRAYLAGRVFGDAEALARLNAIVHPRVYDAFEAWCTAAPDDAPLLVKEAALIFETGGDRHLDAVAVVDAPVAVRVARVTARDGVTAEAVHARVAHQMDSAELRRRADYVIVNDGPEEALRARVREVFDAVRASVPRI